MPYSSEEFLALFQRSFLETETAEERIEALRAGNVWRYRAKTWRIGDTLECEIFPIWNTQGEAARAKKAKASRPAQQHLNQQSTKKAIARLSNNNFTKKDIWITLGYDDQSLPETPTAARRDLINYLRRVKRRRKALGLPALRYIYVTEWEDGTGGTPIRTHHHIILSGDMDRDWLENQWQGGAYPQARRLRPKDCGITGLALYIAGQGKRCQRLWGHSQNLKIPKPTIADHKITRRQMQQLAINQNTAPAFFESVFRGYRFQDTERDLQIRFSEFMAGAYVSVRMCRVSGKKRE